MDREKREELKAECTHPAVYQSGAKVLELIADLEAAEKQNSEMHSVIEKCQSLISAIMESRVFLDDAVSELVQRFKTEEETSHKLRENYRLLEEELERALQDFSDTAFGYDRVISEQKAKLWIAKKALEMYSRGVNNDVWTARQAIKEIGE